MSAYEDVLPCDPAILTLELFLDIYLGAILKNLYSSIILRKNRKVI